MLDNPDRKRTIIALCYPLIGMVLLALAAFIAYLARPKYRQDIHNSQEPKYERAVQGPQEPQQQWIAQNPDEPAPFNGHRYQVFTERLTWDQARLRCREMGGHLACITSKEENEFLRKLAKLNWFPEHTTCWIGAADTEQEGQWRWVTQEPFTLTELVVAGRSTTENYLNLRLSSGKWEDYPLEGETAGEQWFACEWEE